MHKFIMTLEDYRMFALREEHRIISVEEAPLGNACISCEGRLDIHVEVIFCREWTLGGQRFYVSKIKYRSNTPKETK